MRTTSITRKSLVADFREALQWLTSLGVDYRQSRFAKYEEFLTQLESPVAVLAFVSRHAYDAAIEASDLVVIHRGLLTMSDPVLVNKLTEFIGGPLHAKDERGNGSSNKPRNSGLELLITAHFAMAGFTVRFDADSDVEVSDGKTVFHVECKRPMKLKTLKRNLLEAYSQLKRRYATYSGTNPQRGIAVIGINKFVNPNNDTFQFQTVDQLNKHLGTLSNEFLERRRSVWYSKLDDFAMGDISCLSVPASLTNTRGRIMARFISGIYTSRTHETDIKKGDPDRLYFREIMEGLNKGYAEAFQL